MSKKKVNLHEVFIFPDFPEVLYPVYLNAESGRIFNLKAVLYPTPTSRKKYTRRKQLLHRSGQAKIFDAIINIGYFDPLQVWTEFPVVIRNEWRLPGQMGSFYLLDYFFPELKLAVELDSDLHNPEKDKIRDTFLMKTFGIETIRITGLDKARTQKKEFKELAKRMREKGVVGKPNFRFGNP